MSDGWAPLVENLAEAEEPVDVVARFLDLPYVLFLDSATGATARSEVHPLGRYSFLSADPGVVIRSRSGYTRDRFAGRRASARTRRSAAGRPRDPAARSRQTRFPGFPPFQGGAAGYIGYDYGSLLERLPASRYDDLAVPDVLLGIYDWVIAWDHRLGTAWVISTGMPETGARARAAREGAARHGAAATRSGSSARRPSAISASADSASQAPPRPIR